MNTSQLERLRQLGDLREKGLLTDEEFAEQKAAVMGCREPLHERGGRSQWLGRIAVVLSLVVAGVALYAALDGRDRAKSEVAALRSQIVTAHPKLVLEDASIEDKPVPADGYSHNIETACPPRSVLVSGGYSSGLSRSPTIERNYADIGVWLVGASSEGKGSKLSVSARCARGEGGLVVEGPTP